MNEENIKLEKVRSSCKAARIVSRIFFIISLVGTIISLGSSIAFLTKSSYFDEQINRAIEDGKAGDLKISLKVGPFSLGKFQNNDPNIFGEEGIHSDIPALQEFFDSHSGSVAVSLSLLMLMAACILAVITVALFLFSSIFGIILKKGNPFDDQVIKRVLVSMIILTGCVTCTSGMGFGLLGGFLTWVIYTILDYGRILKIQADETL